MLSYVISNSGTITLSIINRPGGLPSIEAAIPPDHTNYRTIIQSINTFGSDSATIDGNLPLTEEDLVKLLDIKTAVQDFSLDKVTVRGNVVYYDNKPLQNTMTERLLSLMRASLPFAPFVAFMNNVMLNPSRRAVNELWRWMEHHDIPITENGFMLCYKRTTHDFKDVHTSKFDNHVGVTNKMERNEVNEDWGVACAEGFHVGSMSYVRNFANSPGNHIVIVLVNPKNVVSVPTNEINKCRVCEYTVVAQYKDDLTAPLYTETAEEVRSDEDDSIDEEPENLENDDEVDDEEVHIFLSNITPNDIEKLKSRCVNRYKKVNGAMGESFAEDFVKSLNNKTFSEMLEYLDADERREFIRS